MTKEIFMKSFNSIRAGMGILKSAAVLALITTVAACTAGGPATTSTQQTTPGDTTSSYTGPAAANADVQAFKVNLWENIRTSDKCGGCHHEGGQSPMFARSDDVNLAYQAANPLVNFWHVRIVRWRRNRAEPTALEHSRLPEAVPEGRIYTCRYELRGDGVPIAG
jgi:hypothetical protein